MGTKQVGIFISAGIFLCLCARVLAAPPVHTVSGYVRTGAGAGVEGVNVAGSSGATSAVTGADGAYSITVPNKWDGTITVSKTGWLITPGSRMYSNVSTDILNENYVAFRPKISGTVTKSDGTPLEGVVLTANNSGGTAITNASGYYELFVPYNWSGTLSATLSGYSFIAKSYSNLTSDQPNQNFTAFQPTISGYVRKADGTALSGATVTASNGGGSAVTNSSGFYQVTVPYTWSGTVSASLAGYLFTAKSFYNVTADQVNQNFSGFQPTISGYVQKVDGTPLASATVTANNGGGSAVTNSSGFYQLIVPYSWSGTLSASLVKYSFTAKNYVNIVTNQTNQNFVGPFIYSGGDGSTSNPYQIADIVEFMQLSATSTDWSKAFILTADIVFDPNNPAHVFAQAVIAPDTNTYSSGFQGTQFTGIFDGNGHTISNLKISALGKDYIGLFGCIGSGGQVNNLGVLTTAIKGRYFVSGLAGYNFGTITSCYATGAVSGTQHVGGLVGTNNHGTITSCYTTGTVSGIGSPTMDSYYVGGLVG